MSKTERKKKKLLGRILGGSILESVFTERLFLFLVIVFFLAIIYINDRYICQWKLIEINQLQSELKEIKRNARARLSELMGDSRKSLIEEKLTIQGSDLLMAEYPPYIIFDINRDSQVVNPKDSVK